MIQIDSLVKDYGPVRAVNNLSLNINKGEIIGLLGPNGAGKSTTLRTITGYLKATSGTVFVDGIDVSEDPLKVKTLIGYLPESAPLYSDMMVIDYLDFVAGIRGLSGSEREERVTTQAKLCGISHMLHKNIGDLSKGYKQRVGLATAMMGNPQILILDEPTSGLDPNQIIEIRSLIKEIGKTRTVIFSTHILSEAEATCNRIIIINRGEVVADGTPEMIEKKISANQKLTFKIKCGDESSIENKIKKIEGISNIIYNIEKSINETTFIMDCDGDLREKVYKIIKNSNAILLEFMEEKKSLEDLFRVITSEENSSEK